jgi:hypothetical protein
VGSASLAASVPIGVDHWHEDNRPAGARSSLSPQIGTQPPGEINTLGLVTVEATKNQPRPLRRTEPNGLDGPPLDGSPKQVNLWMQRRSLQRDETH